MSVDLLNQILNEALVCSCNSLMGLCDEPPGPCGCPCRLFISAGPPVADLESCCDSGQLSVHVTNLYPFSNFPQQAGNVNLCQTPLAADFTVTLLRCFPTLKDDGSAPTAAELQTASEAIYRDMFLLTNGLLCCLMQPGRKRKFVFRGSNVGTPQGGCISIEVRFTVELFSL